RPPQPIRPTLSVSPPPAWTAGATARTAPAAADDFRKVRRVAPGIVGFVDIAGPSNRLANSRLTPAVRRMDLELADEQLEPFRLQQALARGREAVVGVVDDGAVDADGDRPARADALDASPLAEGALDVVLAARVEQLLEIGVVPRPPQLPAG